MSLHELLENVQSKFAFLFERYNFTAKHTFERSNPIHIRIGLESNKLPHVKILFLHEWAISVMIGSKDAKFEGDSGWFSLRRIVDFRLNRPMRWPAEKIDIPYNQFLLKDLDESAIELNENCEAIFRMFENRKKDNQWETDFKKYVTTQIRYRFSRQKIDK